MENKNFTCKYCSHHSTITDPDQYSHWVHVAINESTFGKIGIRIYAITCPNPKCKKLSLSIGLTNSINSEATRYQNSPTKIIKDWELLPESSAKVLPDYIPTPIQEDYYEACRIVNLSPKASATLSRRCLQGIIRDFFGISKGRLKDEIDALKDKIDQDVFDAIDAVRDVGNIGAHMEKDINLIVDVEVNEAQLLIELIEQLIEEWYVNRFKRSERMTKVKNLATTKKMKKDK